VANAERKGGCVTVASFVLLIVIAATICSTLMSLD